MSDFKHYILTRFNIRFDGSKPYEDTFSDSWMHERMELFEKFCAPSFRNQTCKNFEWLIFLDEERTAPYLERLKGILKGIPHRMCFVKGNFEVLPFFNEITSGLDCPLITTRIDNDDIIHRDFISDIQRRIHVESNRDVRGDYLIDFPKLISLEMATGQVFWNYYNGYSPFISLVENFKTEGPERYRTVFCSRHNDLGKHFPEIIRSSDRRGVILCHEGNVSNNVKTLSKLRVVKHLIKKRSLKGLKLRSNCSVEELIKMGFPSELKKISQSKI